MSIKAFALRFGPAVGIAAWVLFAWMTVPSEYPNWYRCVFHSTTGWYCAGCGSTRATHMLTHGEILASLRQNPLVLFLGVPAAIWFLLKAVRPTHKWSNWLPGFSGWGVLCIVLVFWVVRNLPAGVFDVLRPSA